MQKLRGVYQTTIPVELVRYLKWRHGDYLVFYFDNNDSLIVKKLDPKEFPQLFKINRGEIQNG